MNIPTERTGAPHIIDESIVRRLLTPDVARELMRGALLASARGTAVNPVRTVIAANDGWFATMPAFVGDDSRSALGAKLVTAFPGNLGRGIATHQALVVLFEPRSGEPLALVAGQTITERRTAAVSVLATERLAKRPRGTLAILGAGVQARVHLEAFSDAGLLRAVRVWSQTAAHAAALVDCGRTLGVATAHCASAAEAVASADVVVTATAASEPIFDAEALAQGAHVNAVGACVPSRRELPTAFVRDAAIYVEDIAAARREAGDLLIAEAELGDPLTIRATLGEMLAETQRPVQPARFTLFESLGLGLEDVACASYVYSRTMANGDHDL